MEDNRTARHDRCVFCGGFRLLFFSLAGTGPIRKVYVPDTARIVISPQLAHVVLVSSVAMVIGGIQ